MNNNRTASTYGSRRRLRLLALGAAAGIVLAACGGAAGSGVEATGADTPTTSAQAAPTTVSDPAPSIEFALFDGGTASFADYAGRPLVVNFWASWCPSCVAEMSAAFRPVQESVGEEVTFLGMNIQDQRELALDLLDETGVQWISAEDPNGELYTELGGLGMPFTVLIDPSGGIVDSHNGPLSESQLREKLAEHFGI